MKDFILPDIGEGIVECELLKWLVSEGDLIKEDQAVAEVMTDKATVEIPAMHDGKVAKLYYKEGDIAKVHEPLFAIVNDDEALISKPIQDEVVNTDEKSESVQVSTQNNQQVEPFVLPDIGEGIVECEIMEWLIKEGDTVNEDQVVVEVMTDKAVVEIPAKYDGKIVKIHYQKGDIAKVHTPLFDQLINDGLSNSNANGDVQAGLVSKSNAAQTPSFESSGSGAIIESKSDLQGGNFEAPVDVSRALASPAVRRLARELGIKLNECKGSGKKGRVLKHDLISMNSTLSSTQNSHQSPPQRTDNTHTIKQDSSQVVANAIVNNNNNTDIVEPIKGIKAAMARQMMASVSTIPHFSVSDELCMDNLISLRANLKPIFEKQGLKLSFLPFFIKALSLALQSFPIINSRLNDAVTELTYLSAHNIGVAIDGKLGLMVPSIKNVESLSLVEVTQELNRLIDAARDGKLSNADLNGGTISISNIGALGGITATPVINKPDVAIVALGKTQKLPRFNDQNQVYASNIMTVNWSGDHRVIDGATMVKFNNLWMDYLMNPDKMLMYLR